MPDSQPAAIRLTPTLAPPPDLPAGGHPPEPPAYRTLTRLHRSLIACVFALFALFAQAGQAWADTFFVVRGDALNGNATSLFTWNDVTNVETLIAANTYVGAPFTGQIALVDGLALHPTTGILYGFVIDDTTNATLIPVDSATSTTANTRSQLVVVDTTTGAVTPVNLANWNDGLAIYGAAFDPDGNLWAVDILSDQVLRVDLATGLAVAGSAVPVGVDVTITVDLAFTANGVGVIVTGDFTFYVFDPVQNTVIPLTAAPATPVGFDSGLVPPFGVAGVAFTTHLAARNLDATPAQVCRLNLYEGRGQDQYGHADDPFHSNPIIAYADLDAGTFNSGPGDMASDVFPNCLFDFGDAPASYDAGTPARHGLSPNVKLGALVDAESGPLSSTNADGDDLDGIDDEDALSGLPRITLPASPAQSGQTVSLTVPCAPDGAFVVGYIDFDGGGTFGTGQERSATATCSGGSAEVVWTFANNLVTAKNTYLRLRIASNAAEIQSPTGPASDGEVEDYRIILDPPAQTPFGFCDARAFLFQDNPSNGYAVNLVTGAAPLIFPNMANLTNGIGYNQVDNFIWGSCLFGCPTTGAASDPGYLTRVGAGGGNTDIGPIPGLPGTYHIGDVHPDGLLYLTDAGNQMYVVDLRPTSLTYLTVITTTTFSGFDGNPNQPGVNLGGADWAFHPGDGQLYSVIRELDPNNNDIRYSRLLRINPVTGQITNLGLLRNNANTANINFGSSTTGWGAMYFDNAGYLYISENGTGRIHRVDITDPSLPNQYRAVLFANGPSSGSNDGARCNAAPLPVDFGDAPDSYGTLLASNGPRHAVPTYNSANQTAALMLGSRIDIESDGQPTPGADGDDNNGAVPDDEDGVVFNPAPGYATPTLRTGLDPVTLQPVQNVLEVTASAAGLVSIWVDWNQDSDFDDPGERVVNAQPVSAGVNPITFAQGANPPDIFTYVRVRLSSDATAIATPYGPAPDGEVEDYRVQIERLVQPDACTNSGVQYYAFTFSQPINPTGSGGVGSTARYANVAVVNGVPVDMFVETIAGTMNSTSAPPNGFRVGDGSAGIGPDDARWQINGDATIRYTFYEAGTTTPVAINGVFTVNDMDGSEFATFSAADLAGYAVTQGSAVQITESGGTVVFSGNGAWNGDPQSRFQVVLEGIETFEVRWQGGSNSGFGFDGDGDLTLQPPACEDWGDAPDSYGTTAATNGPNHTIVPGLLLGSLIDFDPDGRPTPGADGDDTTNLADEDGVTLPATMAPGQTLQIPVEVVGDGLLQAWIDWDGNGVFDPADRIATDLAVTTGINHVNVTVPADAMLGTTYARFRLSTQTGLGATGPAPDGEVEDYLVTIATPSLSATKQAALQTDADGDGVPSPGDTLRYTIVINNGGAAGVALGVQYTDLPDANTALAVGSVTTSQGTITTGNNAGDTTVAVDIGDIPGGGAVTIVYEVTINNPVAAGVTQVRNQGIVDPQNPDIPDTLTDDPDTPTPGDPTFVPIVAAPVVNAYKSAALAVDADGDGVPSPGDTLLYTIQIRNSGNQDAPDVSFSDLLDANTTLVVGSVTTDLGTVTTGNGGGDTSVAVAVGTLPGGGGRGHHHLPGDHPQPAAGRCHED